MTLSELQKPESRHQFCADVARQATCPVCKQAICSEYCSRGMNREGGPIWKDGKQQPPTGADLDLWRKMGWWDGYEDEAKIRHDLRDRAIANGQKLLTEDEVLHEVANRRGGL